jgi:hypothetical protein
VAKITDDLLDLCRGCLKYGSSVRVPDSGNRINSTEIVAKYDEFESFYLRGYTEVGNPVLARELAFTAFHNIGDCLQGEVSLDPDPDEGSGTAPKSAWKCTSSNKTGM